MLPEKAFGSTLKAGVSDKRGRMPAVIAWQVIGLAA
jgi:hypothetical protein